MTDRGAAGRAKAERQHGVRAAVGDPGDAAAVRKHHADRVAAGADGPGDGARRVMFSLGHADG